MSRLLSTLVIAVYVDAAVTALCLVRVFVVVEAIVVLIILIVELYVPYPALPTHSPQMAECVVHTLCG